MTIKTKAIVLKHNFLSEEDKMLFLLSGDYGLIEAKARGVKRMKSPLLNSTEDCCYSDFCLFSGKSGYIVNSADKLDNFYGLRNDIEKISLASYFCELTYYLTPTADNAEVFLRLLCNTFYLLANDKRSVDLMKPIFELRALSESGFAPNLVACDGCGQYQGAGMTFLPLRGILLCGNCLSQTELMETEDKFPLTATVLAAMRHILFSEMERLFNFKISDRALSQLNRLSEYYVQFCLERSLHSLEFYKSLKAMP